MAGDSEPAAAPMSVAGGQDATLQSAPGANDHSDESPEFHSPANSTADDEKLASEGKGTIPLEPATASLGAAEEPLATKALQFVSTATPATLASISVGFASVVYIIFGRLGLVLIGAVGGILGFISWEARNPEVSRAIRGEKGIDVLERLHLEKKENEPKAKKSNGEEEHVIMKALDDFRPETKEALSGLIDAAIRDYVKHWYNPIIPNDHAFPLAARKSLTSYFLAISNHLYRKRPADAFLDLLTNSASIVIVFMSELSAAFADLPPESTMKAEEVIAVYLAAHPDCHLANLLNHNQQATKFKMVAEDLLQYLDRSSLDCDPVRIFFREIISNTILEATLQTCSKAEWINGWIVYLLEAGEPDLNQAIDVGMQTGRDSMPNAFADMDGNIGNISIAKPGRSSAEMRRKDGVQTHKKKLSKADEEAEVVAENIKKTNGVHTNRDRASTVRPSMDRPAGIDLVNADHHKKSFSTGESSVQSNPSTVSRTETLPTPLTPGSPSDIPSLETSPPKPIAHFTSFDQIAPPVRDEELDEDMPQPKKPPLTLHNANFTIHDDAGDQSRIRTKPNWDYLIQVEPSSSHYSGWMIVRRYSDFETLHEILRRIAAISGATAFTELHTDLPSWKVHTRQSLRGELERYLRDACWYASLAESEGMKRFLEKSKGHTHTQSESKFAWDTMGKNMMDALTGPKGAMESGKQLVGGVQNVFGNFPGLNRKNTSQSVDLTASASASRLSLSTPARLDTKSPVRSERASMDSERSSVISTQPGKMPPMERRPSYQSQPGDYDMEATRVGRSERNHSSSGLASGRQSHEHSRASSLAPTRSPSSMSLSDLRLPPHPDEISDDYVFPGNGESGVKSSKSLPRLDTRNQAISPGTPSFPLSAGARKSSTQPSRQYSQLTEGETRVAVELIFAVINEMYTLSSAWNIRRTLLTAAKSFLLRPGNPSLLTVQNLIQSSVLDANTSDAGIAEQLRMMRENAMPTEAERANWPAEMTAEEKEKLRVRARQLLIRSGVPAALMGVMGQAATSEALGRVFDCLQIEEVARGLIFGLMLQAVRLVTH